jgi:hypothetical protein
MVMMNHRGRDVTTDRVCDRWDHGDSPRGMYPEVIEPTPGERRKLSRIACPGTDSVIQTTA